MYGGKLAWAAAVIGAALAFWAGMTVQQIRYDDICLVMGGGRDPGAYPICVVERATGLWIGSVPAMSRNFRAAASPALSPD